MAETANFALFRGDDQDVTFTGVVNSSVAGWTTRLTARLHPATNDPPILSIVGTIVDVGSLSTPGIFKVTISKALSLTLSPRVYYYSFKRTDGNFEKTLTQGKLRVDPDILNPV